MIDPRAEQLIDRLMMLMAGERMDHSLAALVQQLAATIGFASDTRADASRICASVPAELERLISIQWKTTRKHRAAAKLNPTGGRMQ